MKARFTFIVASSSEGTARKFVFPRRTVGLVAGAVAVFLIAVLLSSLHYYSMWNRTRDYGAMQSEVDQLRRQNEAFRNTARQLTERMSAIEVAAQKLRIASGLDDPGLGGVGGPSPVADPVLSLDGESLQKHFKSLDRKSITLQGEVRKLHEFYKDRSILLAATPSMMPVRGYPSDRYGMRSDPFTGTREFHAGIDISAPKGNKVVATADGIVHSAGRQLGYGNLVVVNHRFGITTRYGHLAKAAVKKGQRVKKGDVIGYVGATGRATGPHVHYEVRLNGRPYNPLRFMDER